MPTIVNISAGTLSTSGNSITVSNTPGAGTDYVVAVVQLNSGSGADTAATYSLTYGLTSATELVESLNVITRDSPTVVMFGFRGPPSGANDVTFTVSHSGVGPAGMRMTVYNLSDVGGNDDISALSGVPKALFVGFGNSATFDLTTLDPNTLVIGGVGVQGGDITITEGVGYTDDGSGFTTSSATSGIAYMAQHKSFAAAGLSTFDVTWSDNDGATLAAAAFKSAAAASDQAVSDSLSTSSATATVGDSAGSSSVSTSSATAFLGDQAVSDSLSTSSASGSVLASVTAGSSSVSTSSASGFVLAGAVAGSDAVSTSSALGGVVISGTASSSSLSAATANGFVVTGGDAASSSLSSSSGTGRVVFRGVAVFDSVSTSSSSGSVVASVSAVSASVSTSSALAPPSAISLFGIYAMVGDDGIHAMVGDDGIRASFGADDVRARFL